MNIAFTGHRQLQGKERLVAQLTRQAISDIGLPNIEWAFSGMALGFDHIAANVCLDLGIKVCGCIPCLKQETVWALRQQEEWRRLCARIVSAGGQLVQVTNASYSTSAMELRNRYMVNRCQTLIACWDGTPGGTGNAIKYAMTKSAVDIINLWKRIHAYQLATNVRM